MSDAEQKTEKPSADEPVVIKLRHPITFGSRTIEQITIRPVKAKDLRSIKPGSDPMATTLLMASKLSGQTDEVIDELSGDDLRDVLDAVNTFFFAIQETGQRSSGT